MTASLDSVHFLRPCRLGSVAIIAAMVNRTFASSMEVCPVCSSHAATALDSAQAWSDSIWLCGHHCSHGGHEHLPSWRSALLVSLLLPVHQTVLVLGFVTFGHGLCPPQRFALSCPLLAIAPLLLRAAMLAVPATSVFGFVFLSSSSRHHCCKALAALSRFHVDGRMQALKSPTSTDDQACKAHICGVQVGVRVEEEEELSTGSRHHCCSAYLTFVSVSSGSDGCGFK